MATLDSPPPPADPASALIPDMSCVLALFSARLACSLASLACCCCCCSVSLEPQGCQVHHQVHHQVHGVEQQVSLLTSPNIRPSHSRFQAVCCALESFLVPSGPPLPPAALKILIWSSLMIDWLWFRPQGRDVNCLLTPLILRNVVQRAADASFNRRHVLTITSVDVIFLPSSSSSTM